MEIAFLQICKKYPTGCTMVVEHCYLPESILFRRYSIPAASSGCNCVEFSVQFFAATRCGYGEIPAKQGLTFATRKVFSYRASFPSTQSQAGRRTAHIQIPHDIPLIFCCHFSRFMFYDYFIYKLQVLRTDAFHLS